MHGLDAGTAAAHAPAAASTAMAHASAPATSSHGMTHTDHGGTAMAAVCAVMLLAVTVALVHRPAARRHAITAPARQWVGELVLLARAVAKPPPPVWLLVGVDRR